MYGKHFASMYSGSMVGMGAPAFAVMGYILSTMRPDKTVGAQVELNPKLLSLIIGEPENAIVKVIQQFCAPDPKSRSKAEEGRKLIKLGEYDYRVVNGPHYMALRNEEDRRNYNRRKQAELRAKKQKRSLPLPGEQAYCAAAENGASDAELDGIVGRHLPVGEASP